MGDFQKDSRPRLNRDPQALCLGIRAHAQARRAVIDRLSRRERRM